MTKPILSGPPSPEEFQRQLTELMRQHFRQGNAGAAQKTDFDTTAGDEDIDGDKKDFKFDYRPKDVKAYLDRFVIKQDDAKKVLSVALCDHYHQVRRAFEGKETPNYAKQNIILIGPT